MHTTDVATPATPTTDATGSPDSRGVFSDRLRRTGVIYAAVTAPTLVAASAFTHGEKQYLMAWLVSSAFYTTPAIVLTFLAGTRANPADRTIWRLWLVGLVFVYLVGTAIFVYVLTDWAFLRRGGAIAVTASILVYGAAVILMVRSRSGDRAVAVDIVEDSMIVIAIMAPVVLLFGEQVLRSEAAWFAVPSAVAAVGILSALGMTLSLFMRIGRENRVVETMGLVLAAAATAGAFAQVAQAVSGFSLPSPPFIALQVICMGLLLLIPLHLPRQMALGLDRLPPHEQVRDGYTHTILTVASLPLLLVGALVARDREPWALPFALSSMCLLIALATLRYVFAIKETKRLFAQVERAAADRRVLLAEVMQSADADRHRVAAQLHEQAVASYAAFVSFMGATQPSASGRDQGSSRATTTAASNRMRDDLRRQAEALRQLMLAIKPLEVDESGSRSLDAPIRAFVDSLYGDMAKPSLDIVVDPEVVLDWPTETIVLRIVQEALRNVWAHSHASAVAVSIRVEDGTDVIELCVADDGIGFDTTGMVIESGIASMRAYAAFRNGSVAIDSARDAGTRVVARLDEPAVEPPPPTLRLVEG